MNCKIHVNLSQGLFEAEGPEQFVLNAYKDFKDNLTPHFESQEDKQKTKGKPTTAKTVSNPKTKPLKKKKSGGPSYSLVKDLDLYKKGDIPGIEDFMSGFSANTNPPRYLLITHYLKEMKGVENVGPNHFYTCFKKLGVTIPNIEQGLWDTSSKKGWLNTATLEDVKIEVAGENAIAHDLVKNSDK